MDPQTGAIPADPAEQVRLVFANVRRFMEAAGGSVDDIVRMTVYIQEESFRELVNQEWVALFPDPDSRPARHSVVSPLRGGALVQVEVVALVGEAGDL